MVDSFLHLVGICSDNTFHPNLMYMVDYNPDNLNVIMTTINNIKFKLSTFLKH